MELSRNKLLAESGKKVEWETPLAKSAVGGLITKHEKRIRTVLNS